MPKTNILTGEAAWRAAFPRDAAWWDKVKKKQTGHRRCLDACHDTPCPLPCYACAFEGARYDTGSLVGYLRASVALALQRPELAQPVRDMLAALLAEPK